MSKFHVGQKIYLTGGPNGDRKIPGEVVKGPDEDGDFKVRIDWWHGFFEDDARDKWAESKMWPFGADGNALYGECRIIPAEPAEQDFTGQWPEIQAFGKKHNVTVPDLPEPEDPDIVGLREAFAVEYEKRNYLCTARDYRKGVCNEASEFLAALAYVKKVRAECEGEG